MQSYYKTLFAVFGGLYIITEESNFIGHAIARAFHRGDPS